MHLNCTIHHSLRLKVMVVLSFPIHSQNSNNKCAISKIMYDYSILWCALVCVRLYEQICNMQYCDYDFSLLLQMALDKVKPDEIVGRDIGTTKRNMLATRTHLLIICGLSSPSQSVYVCPGVRLNVCKLVRNCDISWKLCS